MAHAKQKNKKSPNQFKWQGSQVSLNNDEQLRIDKSEKVLNRVRFWDCRVAFFQTAKPKEADLGTTNFVFLANENKCNCRRDQHD